jgi:hypothetical protein
MKESSNKPRPYPRWRVATYIAIALLTCVVSFRWWQSFRIHALPFSWDQGQSHLAFWNIHGEEQIQMTSGWPPTVTAGNRNCVRSGYSGSVMGLDRKIGPATYWEEWSMADGWDPVANVAVPGGLVLFRSLDMPHWFLLVVSLGLFVLPVGLDLRDTLRRHKRLRRGHCVYCDYDLRAHEPGQRCPECGTEFLRKEAAR